LHIAPKYCYITDNVILSEAKDLTTPAEAVSF
jgi:hypothetical protein